MKSNLKAKQKAHELIIKSPYANEYYMGKICALMIIDEILKIYEHFDKNMIKSKYESTFLKEYNFWKEVEKELRKDDPSSKYKK